jgi:hypothetical protein
MTNIEELNLERNTIKQRMAQDNCIFLCRVGSTMYGTATKDSDDDMLGIFINDIEYVAGRKCCDIVEFLTNASNSGIRNKKGDKDYKFYSLTRWIELAERNNPNVLELLFAPENCILHKTKEWDKVIENKNLFISLKSYHSFNGYAFSQMNRTEIKSGNNTGRKDLIEKYGYDCYHKDTEFLTKDGWKLYGEINDDVEIATLNPLTHDLEFQIPTKRINKRFNGKLYHFKQNYTEFKITPKHNMYISDCHRNPYNNFNVDYLKEKETNWRLEPVDKLNKGKRSMFYILNCFNNKNIDFSISDDLLKIIGLYVSEGTLSFIDGNYKDIRIVQTKNGKKEVFDIMNNLPLEYGFKKHEYKRKHRKNCYETIWASHNKKLLNFIYSNCGHYSEKKRIPKFAYKLSKKQADILLHCLLLGDGTKKKTIEDTFVYYTNNKLLADDVQMLSLLSGRDSNVMGGKDGYIADTSFSESNMFQVLIKGKNSTPKAISINTNRKKTYGKIREGLKNGLHTSNGGRIEKYNDNVVCFEVPNGILITRLNGKIAIQGNCKLVSHTFRLYYECMQLLKEGRITMPLMNNKEILFIKNGGYPGIDGLKLLQEKAKKLEDLCTQMYALSTIRHSPDKEGISKLQTNILTNYWKETNQI